MSLERSRRAHERLPAAVYAHLACDARRRRPDGRDARGRATVAALDETVDDVRRPRADTSSCSDSWSWPRCAISRPQGSRPPMFGLLHDTVGNRSGPAFGGPRRPDWLAPHA